MTFETCGCTYDRPIPAQQPRDSSRLIRAEPVHDNPPSPSATPPGLFDSARTKLYIMGHCRIHEFAQFLAVHKHILDEGQENMRQAQAMRNGAEGYRIRCDIEERLRAMGLKLMARWRVIVCFGDGLGPARGPVLRFRLGERLTGEEGRMHDADEELKGVFEGQ
jgi:hypothetical protein